MRPVFILQRTAREEQPMAGVPDLVGIPNLSRLCRQSAERLSDRGDQQTYIYMYGSDAHGEARICNAGNAEQRSGRCAYRRTLQSRWIYRGKTSRFLFMTAA